MVPTTVAPAATVAYLRNEAALIKANNMSHCHSGPLPVNETSGSDSDSVNELSSDCSVSYAELTVTYVGR